MKTLKSSPPVNELLEAGKCSGIIKKAQQLCQWQLLLSEIDPELAEHCHIANTKGTELIVEADSAAWGMRLKFLAPDLLRRLNKKDENFKLTNIKHFIQPPRNTQVLKYWSKLPLSNEAAQTITEAAAYITDPVLKEAMLRLSRGAP